MARVASFRTRRADPVFSDNAARVAPKGVLLHERGAGGEQSAGRSTVERGKPFCLDVLPIVVGG